MSEEENNPLDFEEVIDAKQAIKEEKSRKRLAFFLELIPLTILLIALLLKYFDQNYWWWWFSVGAVMACLNYLFISWFFFKPKDYDPLQLGITMGFGICFALGLGSIVLRSYSWLNSTQFYSLAVGGTCFLLLFSGVLLLANIKDDKGSRFYRLTIARLIILLAILLRIMG